MSKNSQDLKKAIKSWRKLCESIQRIAIVNAFETIEEKTKRIYYLEQDYIRWFEYYFPNFAKKKSAWFHKRLANDIIKNRRIRELAEIFRSGGKSVHIDMGIPLFLYLVKKELWFMLLIGQTDPKAKRLIGDIQAQLQYNPRLINDYGCPVLK